MSIKYFTAVKDLSATAGGASGDVVYTCPANHVSVVKTMFVSNGASSAKKYSLQLYDASATSYLTIADETTVAANTNDFVVQGGACIALQAGDKIVAFEESSSDFHVLVSGEEYFKGT